MMSAMGTVGKDPIYVLCKSCSHVISAPEGLEKNIDCDRCGSHNYRVNPRSASWSLAFSLTALIFYIPANVYPFMTIELYGNRNSSTIWQGIVSLNESGSWPIA